MDNAYAAALLGAKQRIRQEGRSREVKRATLRAAGRETFIFCSNKGSRGEKVQPRRE